MTSDKDKVQEQTQTQTQEQDQLSLWTDNELIQQGVQKVDNKKEEIETASTYRSVYRDEETTWVDRGDY